MLEVLAATESSMGVTQVARLAARGTRSGHQLVLDRLVEHGLVVADPTNRGFVYRLNREHLLAPAVLSAVGARQVLFEHLRRAVVRFEPIHASVFGSVARGEGHAQSDIDLLVVMPEGYEGDEARWHEQLRELESRVLGWTGNRLEVLAFSVEQLRNVAAHGEPIVTSLLEESLTLAGPDLRSLLPELRSGRIAHRPNHDSVDANEGRGTTGR